MGLQKYRADVSRTMPDGAIAWSAKWIGGPSLSKITDCACEDGTRRTVYIQGDCDTFFSRPAAISVKGKRVKGYITMRNDNYLFVACDSGRHINRDYSIILEAMMDKIETARLFSNPAPFDSARRLKLAKIGLTYLSE